jgi:hypothetical protein
MAAPRVHRSTGLGSTPAALALLLSLLLPARIAAQTATQPGPLGWSFAMKITVDSGRGNPQEVSTRFQVADRHQRIEVAHAPIDEAVFKVPNGYQTTDMREMMANQPSGMMETAMQSLKTRMMKQLCGAGAP